MTRNPFPGVLVGAVLLLLPSFVTGWLDTISEAGTDRMSRQFMEMLTSFDGLPLTLMQAFGFVLLVLSILRWVFDMRRFGYSYGYAPRVRHRPTPVIASTPAPTVQPGTAPGPDDVVISTAIPQRFEQPPEHPEPTGIVQTNAAPNAGWAQPTFTDDPNN